MNNNKSKVILFLLVKSLISTIVGLVIGFFFLWALMGNPIDYFNGNKAAEIHDLNNPTYVQWRQQTHERQWSEAPDWYKELWEEDLPDNW